MESEVKSDESSRISIARLAGALSKAQGQIQAALKTSENPAFVRDGKKSTYADIAEVIEVIQKPASDNGLSVIFNFKFEDMAYIKYALLHSSGEMIESEWIPMFMRDKTLHAFGAANTFMRRQLLKAIYQIPEEDDDGNSESSQGKDKDHNQDAPQGPICCDRPMLTSQFDKNIWYCRICSSKKNKANELKKIEPQDDEPKFDDEQEDDTKKPGITDKQRKLLYALAKNNKWTSDQIKQYMIAAFQIESTNDLDWVSFDKLIKVIQKTTFVKALQEVKGT